MQRLSRGPVLVKTLENTAMATSRLHDSELSELQRRLVVLRGAPARRGVIGIALVAFADPEGPYYRDLSENNRTRSVISEPARGLIYDRNGVLLANNVPSFSLYVRWKTSKTEKG